MIHNPWQPEDYSRMAELDALIAAEAAGKAARPKPEHKPRGRRMDLSRPSRRRRQPNSFVMLVAKMMWGAGR